MRMKFGRPDVARWQQRFDLPVAVGDELGLTWLGVNTLLVDDGSHAFLTDGFFSRPGLLKVALGRLRPDPVRIDSALTRAGVTHLDAVVPVHSHYDHVMDAPEVARRTGARIIGGSSTVQVARGGGLSEERIVPIVDGQSVDLPHGTLTFLTGEHCPPDRYPGTITAPVVPPVRTTAYKCGEAWSLIFRHTSGRAVLIVGSAGYRAGALVGQQAEVAYLGVGQLGVQPADYIAAYWNETVRTVGARHVVLTHWDDFFGPLDRPVRALPYAGDDLDVTMAAFERFAAEDGVTLSFPTLWRRESAWRLG